MGFRLAFVGFALKKTPVLAKKTGVKSGVFFRKCGSVAHPDVVADIADAEGRSKRPPGPPGARSPPAMDLDLGHGAGANPVVGIEDVDADQVLLLLRYEAIRIGLGRGLDGNVATALGR